MEMRFCRAAGLDGPAGLADAIREYGKVRLASSDPQAIESFLDSYLSARLAMNELGLIQNDEVGRVRDFKAKIAGTELA
eukprot:2559294-Prorocentrum_lima.AAC.1